MMADMTKKGSDSKERMIAAARRMFREYGYLGTALSDVVTESAAPRGSIYFHFSPAARRNSRRGSPAARRDHIAHTRAAATTSTAGQLIEVFIGRIRDELITATTARAGLWRPSSSNRRPPPIQLSAATRRGFQDISPPGRPPHRKERPGLGAPPSWPPKHGRAWKERSSSARAASPSRSTRPPPN